jgi:nitrogen fixation protein FixH
MARELKGTHVLIALLAFFGVTLAVNIALATYAISSFSGEDVAKPYQQGLDYNKALAARAAQRDLGWSASINLVRAGDAGGIVSATIKGKDGAARLGLKIEASLRRPTDARLDRTILLDALATGEYRAALDGLAAGQWDVIVRTSAGEGTPFEAQRRVVVK